MYQKRPVIQAKMYTGQSNGEGSLNNILDWLRSMAPSPDRVDGEESYIAEYDQFVATIYMSDMEPVDENTPGTRIMPGQVIIGSAYGISLTTYGELSMKYDIISTS